MSAQGHEAGPWGMEPCCLKESQICPPASQFLSSADFKDNSALRSVPGNSDRRTSRSKKGSLPSLSDYNSKARSWEQRCLVSLPPSLRTVLNKSLQSHLLQNRSGLCLPKELASQKALSHRKQAAHDLAYCITVELPSSPSTHLHDSAP